MGVSLYSPGRPGTHITEEAGLEYIEINLFMLSKCWDFFFLKKESRLFVIITPCVWGQVHVCQDISVVGRGRRFRVCSLPSTADSTDQTQLARLVQQVLLPTGPSHWSRIPLWVWARHYTREYCTACGPGNGFQIQSMVFSEWVLLSTIIKSKTSRKKHGARGLLG